MMTKIEKKLYEITKALPESMVTELIDFAEFLKQKQTAEATQMGNVAQRIHQRFKCLEADSLPFPGRHVHRTPPKFEEK